MNILVASTLILDLGPVVPREEVAGRIVFTSSLTVGKAGASNRSTLHVHGVACWSASWNTVP